MLKFLVLMYGDDTVIVADSEEIIVNALKDMEKYCEEWKLDINSTKTKVIRTDTIIDIKVNKVR